MSSQFLTSILRFANFTAAYDNILDPTTEPWRGHIAFARVLMAEFRPQLLVELGTFHGVSFFALCEAVKEEKLPTRCVAVDSWQGDPQAGFYEDEVYEKVKAHAEAHYPHCATLLRSLFDEALPHFEDASIDVLHIDGLHTYEAVRHDFDTWLPKVKPGGIILFHDVNEFREGFGAHKVWDEIVPLTEEAYLFRHSHGLGVWRKPGGQALNPDEAPLLAALLGKDLTASTMVATYITGLAEREVNRIVAQARQQTLQAKDIALAEYHQCLEQAKNEAQQLRDEVHRVGNESQVLKRQLRDTEHHLRTAQSTLDSIVHSRSWKLTAILRMPRRLLAGWAQGGQKCGLLAKLVRALCVLPASFVLHPSFAAWTKACGGGTAFFTNIEHKAPKVFAHMQKRNVLLRNLVILPLKFGLKVRQFHGIIPALYRGCKKVSRLALGSTSSMLPHQEWRFKPGSLAGSVVEQQCGPLPMDMICKQEHRAAPPCPALPNAPNVPDMVDVIIPVYNGREHLERLLPSLFAHTTSPHRFVFIDDKSPDPALLPWLQEQLAGREDCLLLCNDENLGFPATVNKGAALSSGNFVILNSDTVVPVGWLERLMAPLAHEGIASATPFSNAATIFSFPAPGQDKDNTDFLQAMGLEAINASLSGLNAPLEQLSCPTGVGFCMAISRKAFDEHGGFDAQAFGQGYGEEVDWCQKSLRAGWKHVLVPQLYVAHVHGGSFNPEVKAQRIAASEQIINHRYPDYMASVQKHGSQDPWQSLRLTALWRLAADPQRKPMLYLAHCLGGGADLYLQRKVADETAKGLSAYILMYDKDMCKYELTLALGQHKFVFSNVNPASLLAMDMSFLTAIRINNVVDWPLHIDELSLQEWIVTLAQKNGAALEMLFHDFYALCPRINLLTPDFSYCQLPGDMKACALCANTQSEWQIDMHEWRRQWQNLLNHCHSIVFFSQNTLEISSKVYTLKADACHIVPHAPLHLFDKPYTLPPKGPLCVALVGDMLAHHKGSHVVEELALLLRERRPEARIIVIGDFDGKKQVNMLVTGPYNGQYLPDILAHYKVTVALFPSIWPETFSFVTQELCQLQMPLVCFDLGAPAERVRDYAHGLVAKDMSATAALEALEELDKRRKQ